MPALNNQNNAVAIMLSLDLIKETGNVRKEYDKEDIKLLSESIEQHGQLQPIGVKPMELDGKYELVFGHRRFRAFQYLMQNGKPYTQIKAVIVTGNTLVLQLIENVQRTDLSFEEKEAALRELEKIMPRKDIARVLGKSESWVSDLFAGTKVREEAKSLGVNTEGISTKALSVARGIPKKGLEQVIESAKEEGGTAAAVKKAVEDYKEQQAPSFDNFEMQPSVKEKSLNEHPEDAYDFGKDIDVELGEVIAHIANYRYGWESVSLTPKANNIIHTCNKLIEKLMNAYCG